MEFGFVNFEFRDQITEADVGSCQTSMMKVVNPLRGSCTKSCV